MIFTTNMNKLLGHKLTKCSAFNLFYTVDADFWIKSKHPFIMNKQDKKLSRTNSIVWQQTCRSSVEEKYKMSEESCFTLKYQVTCHQTSAS